MTRPCERHEAIRQCHRVPPVSSMKESARSTQLRRRLPVGAEVQPEGGAHFRVWAPASTKVAVLVSESEEFTDIRELALTPEDDGYWSGLVDDARAGMHYR